MKHQEWLFRRQSHYNVFWISIVFIIVLVLLFLIYFSYYPYYQTTGIYRKEEKCVSVLFENTKLQSLEDIEIKVDNKIINKDDLIVIDYVVVDNKLYNQTTIYLDEVIDKQLVTVSVRLSKTTLWKEIWKGMME